MTAADYLISLVSSVANEGQPPEKPEGVSFADVFSLARAHKLESICFSAVKELKERPEENLFVRWKMLDAANIAQMISQENEKPRLVEALREAGIDFLPMKGWYLREMYPRPEYRFMSDLDLLIHDEDRKKVFDLMAGLGYSGTRGTADHVDDYFMKPYLHVEMHPAMATHGFETWNSYYKDIWDKAVLSRGTEYRLGWNDYFIYMMMNFAKDYKVKGSGIRSGLDVHYFIKAHGGELDYSYIDAELDKLEIREAAEELWALSARWFGGSAPAERSPGSMEDKLLHGSVNGSRLDKVKNLFAATSGQGYGLPRKIRYLARRAFPGQKVMKLRYPVLNRFPILMPVYWIKRWILSAKKVPGEIRIVKKLKDDTSSR